MTYRTTRRFDRVFLKLPAQIQKKFYKQIDHLLSNRRHPSLQVKKIQGLPHEVWEARVDLNTHSPPQSPQLAGESRRANTKDQSSTRVEESPQLAGGFFNYRFTFEIHGDLYILRNIGPHDEVLESP